MSDELANQNQATGLVVYNYGDQAGAGYEGTSQKDFSIPFLAILQSGSPQVQDGNAKRIPNAKAGQLFNTVTGEVFDFLDFVPCATQHVFVEWKPRDSGGGIVRVRTTDDPVVTTAIAQSKEFGKYKTPEGNDLVETFYMFGMRIDKANLALIEPMVIGYTSTKIAKYRNLMTKLRTCKFRPPLYANIVTIKTVLEPHPKGQAYNFAFAPANGNVDSSLIPPTGPDGQPHALLLAGQKLHSEVMSGKTKADATGQKDAGEDSEPAPF